MSGRGKAGRGVAGTKEWTMMLRWRAMSHDVSRDEGCCCCCRCRRSCPIIGSWEQRARGKIKVHVLGSALSGVHDGLAGVGFRVRGPAARKPDTHAPSDFQRRNKRGSLACEPAIYGVHRSTLPCRFFYSFRSLSFFLSLLCRFLLCLYFFMPWR